MPYRFCIYYFWIFYILNIKRDFLFIGKMFFSFSLNLMKFISDKHSWFVHVIIAFSSSLWFSLIFFIFSSLLEWCNAFEFPLLISKFSYFLSLFFKVLFSLFWRTKIGLFKGLQATGTTNFFFLILGVLVLSIPIFGGII